MRTHTLVLVWALTACSLAAAAPATDARLAASAPGPAPKLTRLTTAPASATSFWVKLYWSAPGNPDSVLTRWSSGFNNGAHRLRGTVTRDSFALALPAAGVTQSGTACVQSKRIYGGPSAEVCGAWSYTNAGSPPPPPVIDSVRTDTLVVAITVLPTGLQLQPYQPQQFCAYLHFANGKIAQSGNQVGIPLCDAMYTTFPASARILSLQQFYRSRPLCLHKDGGGVMAVPCRIGT